MEKEKTQVERPDNTQHEATASTFCPIEVALNLRIKNLNEVNFERLPRTCAYKPKTSHLNSLAPFPTYPPEAMDKDHFEAFELAKWGNRYIVHPNQKNSIPKQRILRAKIYYLENLSCCRDTYDKFADYTDGLCKSGQQLTYDLCIRFLQTLTRGEQQLLAYDKACRHLFAGTYIFGSAHEIECVGHTFNYNPFKIASEYCAPPLYVMFQMALTLQNALFISGTNDEPKRIIIREGNKALVPKEKRAVEGNQVKNLLPPHFLEHFSYFSGISSGYYGKWTYGEFKMKKDRVLFIGIVLKKGNRKKTHVFYIYRKYINKDLFDLLKFEGILIKKALAG